MGEALIKADITAIKEVLLRRMGEFRAQLLAGTRLRDIEDAVAAETGGRYCSFRQLARQVLPDLAELLKIGKAKRDKETEEGAIADYRGGMPYEEILRKHHIGGVRLCKIISKYGKRENGTNLGDAKRAANARRYAEAVGTVINDLEVLKILPGKKGRPQCLVECISCGRRYAAPAHRTIIRRSERCEACKREDAECESRPWDNLPAAVVESKATLVCIRRAVPGCVISELVHICCAECSRRKERRCRHNCCIASPEACSYAEKRVFRKEECLEN